MIQEAIATQCVRRIHTVVTTRTANIVKQHFHFMFVLSKLLIKTVFIINSITETHHHML